MTTHPLHVLGVSMSNHDRSACFLRDGEIIAAVAEERLDRRKSSEGHYRYRPSRIVLPPLRAITRVLAEGEVGLDDIDLVVCGRSITTCRDELLAQLPIPPERLIEPPAPAHHIAHAYAAFGTSPFEDAAVLVIDEQGQRDQDGRYEKISWFSSEHGRLRRIAGFTGNDTDLSLGMLYNVVAALVGLSEADRPAAGKLMALASADDTENPGLVDLLPDGDVRVPLARLDAFLADAGLPRAANAATGPLQGPDDLLTRYIPISWRSDLAARLASAAQVELRRAVLHTAACLRARSAHDNLAYSGGIALNCTTNACLGELGWTDVFIHPAATDDGNAVGLALFGWVEHLNSPAPIRHFSPYLGPRHNHAEAAAAFARYGLSSHTDSVTPADLVPYLITGRTVCWFSGRSEWGPRALGARSIVADPRQPGIKDRINRTIKHREPFRPFGISILDSAADLLLDLDGLPRSLLPYMLVVARLRVTDLPEVTHVDGTVRPQVVSKESAPAWWALLSAFAERTGLPALLNTSFNTLGEPLVESPQDAVRQFLLTEADVLYVDGTLLDRHQVASDTLQAACAQARADTDLDVTAVALGIEAAGYPDAAVALLAKWGYTDTWALRARGPAATRLNGLLVRSARSDSDVRWARTHAERLLADFSVPNEVSRAALLLASSESTGSSQVAAHLLRSIAGDTDPIEFWSVLLPNGEAPL